MSATQLHDAIADVVDQVTPPPGDLTTVRARGHRIRRRRRGLAAAAATTAVVAVGAVVGVVVATPDGAGKTDGGQVLDPVGTLDLSAGLRAVGTPDGAEIHLGGRTFSGGELPSDLDTDAVVTDAGVVFYRDSSPYLLDAAGEFTQLDAAPRGGADVRPTAKADGALVAYGLPAEGGMEVVVHDLAADRELARRMVECDGAACGDLVIDALDDGAVFLRTSTGTVSWDYASDEIEPFTTGATRVADVRNGVVLYDGPQPATPAAKRYRLVRGAIDAQLTLDGRYVVSWSSRLRPTTPGDPVVVLDQPGAGVGYAFWAIDTDGSVLVAVPSPRGATARVFDCPVSDGPCDVVVDELDTMSGDPVFIGVDM